MHWPTWAWITAAAGALGAVLVGAERMFNVLKSWRAAQQAKHGAEQAKHRMEKARDSLRALQWEQGVERMLRQIEAMDEEVKKKHGSTAQLTPVMPARGEDPEMVAEAWRRFLKKYPRDPR